MIKNNRLKTFTISKIDLVVQRNAYFYTRYPLAYLWSACAFCFGLTIISPDSMGVFDYFCLVLITVLLHIAAYHVIHLKAAKAVYLIQIPVLMVLFLTMIDGFGPHIPFFFDIFEAFKTNTTVLMVLELLGLLIWTPWPDVSKRLYRAIHNICFNTGDLDVLNRRGKGSID